MSTDYNKFPNYHIWHDVWIQVKKEEESGESNWLEDLLGLIETAEDDEMRDIFKELIEANEKVEQTGAAYSDWLASDEETYWNNYEEIWDLPRSYDRDEDEPPK